MDLMFILYNTKQFLVSVKSWAGKVTKRKDGKLIHYCIYLATPVSFPPPPLSLPVQLVRRRGLLTGLQLYHTHRKSTLFLPCLAVHLVVSRNY
jgi:hypothetical protein